jgi:hypothetical protein
VQSFLPEAVNDGVGVTVAEAGADGAARDVVAHAPERLARDRRLELERAENAHAGREHAFAAGLFAGKRGLLVELDLETAAAERDGERGASGAGPDDDDVAHDFLARTKSGAIVARSGKKRGFMPIAAR